jgi:hypothetical protein
MQGTEGRRQRVEGTGWEGAASPGGQSGNLNHPGRMFLWPLQT